MISRRNRRIPSIEIFLLFIGVVSSFSLDNAIVGEPEVICGSDSIALAFHTKQPFGGKIFVKGHVGESNCVEMGDSKNDQKFTIRFDQCGVRRERQINGVIIASTVIVSFHSIFITKIDRAYRLSCFYMESTKTVNQQIDVSALTTQMLEGKTEMPICRYEILSGGSNGHVVQYAKIGDTVFHKWTCVSELEDVYCMRVHSCTVYDGQGGPPVTVLDVNGCQVDDSVLMNLDYLDDLTAGQEAHVFKFADRSGLYFNCQIQLTLKDRQYGCSVAQPDCSTGEYQQIPVDPSPKAEESSEYNASSEERDTAYADRSTTSTTTTTTPGYPMPPEVDTQGYLNTRSTRSPYFAGASGGSGSTPHPKNVHPPGVSPTYSQYLELNKTQNGSSSKTNVSGSSGENYMRLIKRELQNRTEVVADFDLPERSLIVFGLEDQQNENGNEAPPSPDPSQLPRTNRNVETCFTTTKLFLILFAATAFFSSFIIALGVVILRQRRMLSSPYIK